MKQFSKFLRNHLSISLLSLALIFIGIIQKPIFANENQKKYLDTINKTVNMVSNPKARKLAKKHGLNILNVTWEDTGRYKNSSVGPNISDMTIQVQFMNPKTEKYSLHCMPVIRFPNFSDKSCDINPENFYVVVGNERGKKLNKITLKKYLSHLRWFLKKPNSWKGRMESLMAKRDSHVLVSAQACFLPIPKKGIAEFNPVLFNYQSSEKNPAVLAILATREGTSATIIDNKRDAFKAGRSWGQRLFFNQNGKRASLTGQRLSDFIKGQKNNKNNKRNSNKKVNNKENLNMVLLIQVPLKHKSFLRKQYSCAPSCTFGGDKCCKSKITRRSDVENAVIGHGKVEGPFTEIDNLKIERDPRFPIRVTVQFYKATSNGIVSEKDLSQIARQIQKVYKDADYVGSLVTGGYTQRPTEYSGSKTQPPGWWNDFWNHYEKSHGISRNKAIKILKKKYGKNWRPYNKADLNNKIKKIERKIK